MVSKKTTEFGTLAGKMLEQRNLRVSAVASSMGTSPSHAYNVVRGERSATPEFVNAMAMAVQATPQEAQKLNIAAARDAGFSLDLPEDW